MPTSSVAEPSFASKAGTYARRERAWQNTPNYDSVPHDDSLPINSYTDYRDEPYQQLFSGQKRTRISDGAIFYDYAPNSYTHTAGDILLECNSMYDASGFEAMAENTYNEALLEALSRAADAKSNVGVMAAEARKTSDMITGAATRMYQAFSQARRGNFKGAARTLNITPRTSHKSWLEMKYGWMPVLMDVKGSAELFAQQLHGRPPRYVVSASRQGKVYFDQVTNYSSYGGGAPSQYTRRFLGSYTCKVKLWLEVANSNFAAAQQVGLTNPALVAWELVPYSFVFDWFVGVGSYLQGLTALQGLVVRKSMRSNVNDLLYQHVQPSTQRVDSTYVWEMGSRNRSVHRRHYARGPVPSLIPSLPRPKFDLGFSQLTSALALIRGRIR